MLFRDMLNASNGRSKVKSVMADFDYLISSLGKISEANLVEGVDVDYDPRVLPPHVSTGISPETASYLLRTICHNGFSGRHEVFSGSGMERYYFNFKRNGTRGKPKSRLVVYYAMRI